MQAQASKVLLYGYIEQGDYDKLSSKKFQQPAPVLDEVTIEVTSNNEKVQTRVNRESGFYAVVLEAGVKYDVKFMKDGFLDKIFEVDIADIPDDEYDESFKMFIDVALFPEIPGADMTKFETTPMALCKYNTVRDKIIWDMGHAKRSFDEFVKSAKGALVADNQ
jgi:hypothetical protein